MSSEKLWEYAAEMIVGATLNIFKRSYKAEVFIQLIENSIFKFIVFNIEHTVG